MSGGSSHARNLVNGARSVFASGESAMGRKLLARALALDPGDPDALWLDGEACRVTGDLGAARDAYERLLSIEPGHAGAACALALVAHEAAQFAWRAGEAARAEGDLAAALAAYRDALAQNPADGLAAYAAAYLANEPPPPSPPVARPVAYVCIEDFLPAGRHDEVLELTMRDAERFGPAMLNAGRAHDANIRQAEFIDRLTQGDVKHWFLPLVAARLPQVAARLGAGALAPTGVELQMTAHHDGAFFTAHRDAEAAAPRRRVSFVYYYHWLPRRFGGGDLLLYDTARYDERGLTRLAAADNAIVFFPSGALHEVTPVHCEDDDFKSGRFTLNGWIHAA